jgi:LysR family transcriptional regulator for metE and metH
VRYPLLADKRNMNVKLEIRHLRLLDAIAEEGSVTGAAKMLHTTQSALSHQLRDAEERLDARLFLRLGKKMVLTPAGEQLLDAARSALLELGRAEERVNNSNGNSAGIIRLATECYTCYHWLPALLKRFHNKFPKVSVLIDPEATRSPVDALLAGKLDVAILSCPPRDRHLKMTAICDDELVLSMAPDHRLTEKEFVRPRDLEGETIIIYPPRSESTLLQKYMIPAGIEPKGVLEIPLTEAMIEMVASSLGVALLARWAAGPRRASAARGMPRRCAINQRRSISKSSWTCSESLARWGCGQDDQSPELRVPSLELRGKAFNRKGRKEKPQRAQRKH